MKVSAYLISWLFFLLLPLAKGQHLFAQHQAYNFINLTERDGFDAGQVVSIAQDRNGCIWYATTQGLFCYDGYTVKALRPKYGDTQNISGVNIRDVIADSITGHIWIATATAGLNCYDPVKKKFTVFRARRDKADGLVSDNLRRLYLDKKRRLWIGYEGNGWSVMNLRTYVMRHFKTSAHYKNYYGVDVCNAPEYMSEDVSGGMWIPTNNGLVYHAPNDSIYRFTNQSGKNNPEADNLFTCSYLENDSTLWLGTWAGGLVRFNTRNRRFCQYLYDVVIPNVGIHNIVLRITRKSEHELWVATADKGLGVFDTRSSTWSFIPHDPINPNSPLAGECYSLMTDRDGTLWAGFYAGISRLPCISQKIRFTGIQHITPRYKLHSYPTAFYRDPVSGTLYLANNTGKGLYLVNEKSGKQDLIPIADDAGRLSTSDMVNIYSITPINDNSLWLCTSFGKRIYHKAKRLISSLSIKDQDGIEIEATKVLPVKNGYWVNAGATNGFYFVNKNLATATHYYSGKNSPIPFNTERVFVIYAESDTLIWLSSRNEGLRIMNPKTNKSYLLTREPDPSLFGRKMLRDNDGIYWYITEENGVFRITKCADGTWFLKQFTEEDGLVSSFMNEMVLDNAGNLVVSTDDGPCILYHGQNRFISFRNNNIQATHRVSFSTLYNPGDGTIYQGVTGGFLTWNNDSLRASCYRPRLFLSEIQVMGTSRELKHSANGVYEINLIHDQNDVRLTFLAIDYLAPRAVRYESRIENLQTSWQPFDRVLTYSRLATGRYVIRVKAISGMGLDADREVILHITIAPPFWETWWFYGTCAAMLGLILFLGFKWRIALVQKEEQMKTKFNKMIAEVEMKALRAQMNPHFLFNCLNSINRYIVVNQPVEASNYLTKFAKLIRLTLDNSAGDVAPLDSEIMLLRLYLEMETMRFDGQFSYEIQIDEGLRRELISIPTMIIQPYVENAIWHGLLHKGSDGHLSISFRNNGAQQLQVTVTDNGIGREQAQLLKSKSSLKYKSYGMQITNNRINAINQMYQDAAAVVIEDLKDALGQAAGTRVTLTIKYKIVGATTANV